METKNLPVFSVITPFLRLRDEDWFLSFLDLQRVPLHPLEVHLPFACEATLAGVECLGRREDELRETRDEREKRGG